MEDEWRRNFCIKLSTLSFLFELRNCKTRQHNIQAVIDESIRALKESICSRDISSKEGNAG